MRNRCYRTKGLNKALTNDDEIKVKNWIKENRKNISQFQLKV